MQWYYVYIVTYFASMFAIGFYYFLKVKNSDDYLIAGWNMGFWKIVGTHVSTNCGAAVFIGWIGMGFTVGMSGYFKFAAPALLTSMLLIILFSAPLRRQRLYTLADLFSERFGARVGLMPSVFSALVYSVPTTALQIVGMSTIFHIVFGIDVKVGIALSFALILGFTILGGLVATIVTDALQSVIVVLGIVILTLVVMNFGGGVSSIIASTPVTYISPTGAGGLAEVLTFALTVAPFYLVWQSTWQRIFASKDERVAVRAGVTAYASLLVLTLLPFGIGVVARQFVPLDMDPNLIFSYVTVELLHPAVGGIVIVGLLSALMTGADSFILQGASNLSQDIYARMINPAADNDQKMRVARLSVVLISLAALGVAYLMTDIISLYQWALRLSATTLVVPFLAIMFWRRATGGAVLAGMLLACITTLIWPLLNTGVDQVFAGFFVSLLATVGGSLLTTHSHEENIAAVFWENLPSASTRDKDVASTALAIPPATKEPLS
jgi:SSS family solute:Na+ symporter